MTKRARIADFRAGTLLFTGTAVRDTQGWGCGHGGVVRVARKVLRPLVHMKAMHSIPTMLMPSLGQRRRVRRHMSSRLHAALTAPFENTAIHLIAVYLDMIIREPVQYMRACESPLQARAHDTSTHTPVLSANEIQRLRTAGYLVVDDVLSPDELLRVREDVIGLGGEAVSRQQVVRSDGQEDVRTDAVSWVLEDGLGTRSPRLGLATAMRRLRGVASELAAPLAIPQPNTVTPGWWEGFDDGSGATRCEVPLGVPLACQLASYAAATDKAMSLAEEAADMAIGKAAMDEAASSEATVNKATVKKAAGAKAAVGYLPHRDGLPLSVVPRWSLRSLEKSGTAAREVTALLYLNAPGAFRDASTGGELTLHLGTDDADKTGHTASSRVPILPVGGRLVLFDSRRLLHEVRPHTAPTDRLALTCWIGGRWPNGMGNG